MRDLRAEQPRDERRRIAPSTDLSFKGEEAELQGRGAMPVGGTWRKAAPKRRRYYDRKDQEVLR